MSKEDMRKSLMMKAYEVKFDLSGTDYIPLDNIGIGAYGVVCSAVHGKSKDRVAIKKIPYIFDDKRIATRTYREIKILKHFKHDNIISIRDILKPKETIDKFRDVYVVFDLMESDLHKIIYSKQELTEEHVRYFLYQLLRGLKYIHSANVIHRDLKPSNLLVNEDCQLRIGDFGMARGVNMSSEEQNAFMTQYVATRWYRAPEIMFALIEYGTAVDMWSVGCIFAEMLGRKHLFPGKDYINQLKLIIGVLGSPEQDLLDLCQSDLIKKFIIQLGNKEPLAWSSLFPKASKKALSLLSKMLILDPRKRVSVTDALSHPYLNKYHDPDDEPICVPTFNFDFEKQKLTTEVLREQIYKEIMGYHKPRAPSLSFSACLKPVPKDPADKKTDPKQEVSTPGLTKDFKDIQLFPPSEIKGDFLKPDIKPAGVAVDTKQIEVSAADVEMFSAKSQVKADEQEGGDQESKKLEQGSKEEHHETKTISSDTKALIKAALLNSNFRKRSDSSTEVDDKPKPVTAAQRQKEREEKRRKKKEKALERMKKKEKKEQKPDQLLTDEDRELLQRWAKMQKVNPPLAPKVETNSLQTSPGPGASSAQSNSVPQATQGIQNPSQLKSFQASEATGNSSQQSNSSGKSLINVDTMHMLQQKLQARNSLSKDTTVTTVPQTAATNEAVTSNSSLSTINMDGMKMMGLNPNFQDLSNTVVSSSPSQTASTADMGLNRSEASSSFQDFHQSGFSTQDSPQRDYSNNSSPESYQSHGSPDPYNQDSNSSCDAQNPRMTNFSDASVLPSHQLPSQSVGIAQQMNPQFDVSATNPFALTSGQTQSFSSPFQTENAMSNVISQTPQEYSTPPQFGNIASIPFTRNVQATGASPNPQSFFDARYQTQPRQPNSYPRVTIDTSQLAQDQISVLAEQFSSTQVGDNFHPMLPLTPRGTGAGYGVGMDLDSLMDDSSSLPQQQSPLSSSLLTDWMEVTGSLNIDMEALEQELGLQSPMSLSYNDLSLYQS